MESLEASIDSLEVPNGPAGNPNGVAGNRAADASLSDPKEGRDLGFAHAIEVLGHNGLARREAQPLRSRGHVQRSHFVGGIRHINGWGRLSLGGTLAGRQGRILELCSFGRSSAARFQPPKVAAAP